MTFNKASFDSFYPDEEGLIEARKRLVHSAEYQYCELMMDAEWKKAVHRDEQLSYFVELLGGDEILDHIIRMVWYGFER